MEELSDIHKRGNTIIMVTHNPDLTTYASRVIHILDGKIDSDTKVPIETKKLATKVSLASRRKATRQPKKTKMKAKKK
jgi:putative ABC transport system ATP-binding protein